MSRFPPVQASLLAALVLAACGPDSREPKPSSIAADASDTLYSASAASNHLPFELQVSEIRRTPTKSYLLIPGFRDRTAPQARWSMCVFTDLAMARGFTYWT